MESKDILTSFNGIWYGTFLEIIHALTSVWYFPTFEQKNIQFEPDSGVQKHVNFDWPSITFTQHSSSKQDADYS